MSVIIGIFIGLALLAVIAFPERLLPSSDERRKKVGPTYWGFYSGTEDCPPDETVIEAVMVRKKETVIAGSTMYALGRGVNMSSNK